MNPRERFNAIMNFEPVDRGLFTPFFWPWESTVDRWRTEGLGDGHWAEQFGFDVTNDHAAEFTIVPAKTYVFPFYEREVLAEEPGRSLIRDKSGVTKYIRTDGKTMVQFQSWPVCDEASWEEFKQRLDPDTPGRLGDNWAQKVAKFKDRDYVMGIGDLPVGLFSCIREFMGAENVFMACALKPDFVRSMAEHLADFWLKLFTRIAKDVEIDFFYIWELVCNNKGPMISPDMFRDLFLPSYKKLIGGCKEAGIKNIWYDGQGNCNEMLPIMIEAGVTGTLPLEVHAGMDIVEVRQKYPRLQCVGGMERMALVRGKADIDEQLARVAPIVAKGGYLPTIDHQVSSDVPWDNFCYFIEGLKRIISVEINP